MRSPSPAPTTPAPPAIAHHDVTASLPPDVVTDDITTDGRYIGYGGSSGETWRLDVDTGQTAETDGGLLIGDGWGVVDAFSATSPAVYDVATGALVARGELLAGWTLLSIDS